MKRIPFFLISFVLFTILSSPCARAVHSVRYSTGPVEIIPANVISGLCRYASKLTGASGGKSCKPQSLKNNKQETGSAICHKLQK